MLGKNMLTIYSKHSRSTMKYPATGMAHITSGSPYNGTTTTTFSTSPCQTTATKASQHFHHSKPTKPQHQPYPSAPRTYGNKQQFCDSAATSPALSKDKKTFVQEVIGVFQYYAHAVDCTILTAYSAWVISSATGKSNQKHNCQNPPISGLCTITPRCHHHIPSK